MTFETPESEASFYARVEKLLNLAQHKGTGEHEAAAAAAMVQRLLQDRGLSLAHVEARGGSNDPNQIKRGKEATDRRALYLWQQRLMAALARNNMCMHKIEQVWAMSRGVNRKSKQHMLIGRPLNIRVTLLAYDYLIEAIRRMATEEGFGHAERESDHHVFLDAAVDKLKERLDTKREEREEEEARVKREAAATNRHPASAATPGTALVLADVYASEEDANNDVLQGWEPGTTTANRMKREQRQREAEARIKQREARDAELQAQGVPWPKSYYLSLDYDDEAAQKLHDAYHAEEKADAKRSQRRQKERTYQYRGESEKDRRERERQNSPAAQAGRSAGERVNLDEQIENARKSIK